MTDAKTFVGLLLVVGSPMLWIYPAPVLWLHEQFGGRLARWWKALGDQHAVERHELETPFTRWVIPLAPLLLGLILLAG